MVFVVITASAMVFPFAALVEYWKAPPIHGMLQLDQTKAECHDGRCSKCGPGTSQSI